MDDEKADRWIRRIQWTDAALYLVPIVICLVLALGFGIAAVLR